GDLRAGLPPPGRAAWRIGIASVSARHSGSFVEISERALSTSGDIEQFVEIGKHRYSHIIDPRTGLGSRQRKVVTVVASDSTTADAMATALVMADKRTASALSRKVKGVEYVSATSADIYASSRFPKVRLIASHNEYAQ
ncbi:MAG: FAD:protein FMN transferase, partial [Bdellovibrionia bacterium]